jgi:cobalt/nickel transport system permease protein
MSHLHIPDGVLPWGLVLAGWLVTLPALWLASRRAGSDRESLRKVPLLGVVAALVLVAMSTEIVPIAYHINLTVVAGVLLGPWLSIVAAFIVVLMLALIGHGGVTVVGLNTVMIAAEMIVGWALFRSLTAAFGRRRTPWVAAVSTVVTLALTTAMLVGVVWLGGSLAARRDSGALDPATLSFSNPFRQGVVANRLVGPPEAAPEPVSIARFAVVVFTLGPFGWALEAAITAGILGFVARVRPGLVFPERSAPPLGAGPPDDTAEDDRTSREEVA